jgi:hypothetical protein
MLNEVVAAIEWAQNTNHGIHDSVSKSINSLSNLKLFCEDNIITANEEEKTGRM